MTGSGMNGTNIRTNAILNGTGPRVRGSKRRQFKAAYNICLIITEIFSKQYKIIKLSFTFLL